MRQETALKTWVEEQQRHVDEGGVKPSRIVCLGPDGDTWETWSVDDADLPDRVWTTLVRTASTLPHGEAFAVRLVARNSDGETVSQLNHSLRGSSHDHREAASAQLNMQRAMGAALQNGSELARQQREEIERLHRRLELAESQLHAALEKHVTIRLRLAELEAREQLATIEAAAADIRGTALLDVWGELKPHLPELVSSASKLLSRVASAQASTSITKGE